MAETTLDNPGITQAVDRTYAEALFDRRRCRVRRKLLFVY